jgi:arsenate reductase
MTRKLKVLFLCTGNAARSQMAEAFARAMGGGILEPSSGGLRPKGIHPLTVRVMTERAIDVEGQRSKLFRPADAAAADLVVTLCDNARDSCPTLPGGVERRHWPLEDPAAARAGDALPAFRRARDEIEGRVSALVAEVATGMGPEPGSADG